MSTVPLPPTGILATGNSSSSIALTWHASGDPTVTGYDVYAKVWVRTGGPKGSSGGHYAYHLLAANLTTTSDTLTGLAAGSIHAYVVSALNSAGQSLFSYAARAETWIAPRLLYGSNYFQLSSGFECSGPVNAAAGLTTQLTFYVGGNPLKYAIVSGPSTVSIDSKSGVMTYKPATSEVGTVNVTYRASNALGAVRQTIQFIVAARNPSLATPTLRVSGLTATFNGHFNFASATAYARDGVTPVAGSYEFAYNGSATTPPYSAGTYPVLVTFTSADPNYGNATALTHITINKATPALSSLSSPTITVGQATTTVSGYIASGSTFPTADYVILTINGLSEAAPVDAHGNFSASFATGSLAVGTYKITYAFAGDANFNAATNVSSTLTVVPLVVPQVTLNPSTATTSVGDPVSFTSAATGSPTITVQWQVSTDGGLTFTNVTSNASATTTTLIFTASASDNGNLYRAVFTNLAGSATTLAALLTVEDD
jgi:hypothetical protein